MIPLASFALLFALQGGRIASLDAPDTMFAKKPSVGAAVATINGKPISKEDLDDALYDWRMNYVLQDLINDRVIRDAAKAQGFSASDQEVHAEMQKLLDAVSANLPAGRTIDQALAQEGTTRSRLWVRVRDEVLLKKIVLKDFKAADFVKISTIVIVPVSQQSDELKKALDKADECDRRLGAGESWDSVLLSVTFDQASRKALGAVGWRPLAAFPGTVQTQIKAMGRGKHTKPAQTANGIQIFRIDARGADVTGDDLEELKDAYYGGKRNQVMNKLKEDAKVKIGG